MEKAKLQVYLKANLLLSLLSKFNAQPSLCFIYTRLGTQELLRKIIQVEINKQQCSQMESLLRKAKGTKLYGWVKVRKAELQVYLKPTCLSAF